MAYRDNERSEYLSPQNLTLIRQWDDKNEIKGILHLPNGDILKTLENKKYIFPDGKYPIKYQYSPKFKTLLWELKNIPGRTEIKFHQGRTISDTRGCILLSRKDINHLHTTLLSGKSYILHVQTRQEKINSENMITKFINKLLDLLLQRLVNELEKLLKTDLDGDGDIGV